MSFRVRNATCLTPIPSHNSRDTFRATTQGTPANRPLKYHQRLVDHTHSKPANHLTLCYRLALLQSCQAKPAFRSPSGEHVLPGGKRLSPHYPCNYRLARLSLPPGATHACYPLKSPLLPGGSHITARHHISICTIRILV